MDKSTDMGNGLFSIGDSSWSCKALFLETRSEKPIFIVEHCIAADNTAGTVYNTMIIIVKAN